MGVNLYDYQLDAIRHMKNGCILNGGVGSGKSRTSLAYYFMLYGGKLEPFEPMDDLICPDLYIITTARKRDTMEWEGELGQFLLSTHKEYCCNDINIVIDSWNNIGKYKDVKKAFFIFDEDRVTGKGVWVKNFLKITKHNQWILLSATPGDTWTDYIPVFIANGFYKNRTEFNDQHVIFSRFTKYPQVDRYINTKRLIRLRNDILVNMDFHRDTVAHHEDIYCRYDILKYKTLMKERWNIWEDKPIETASELCSGLRKIVNSDDSRIVMLMEIFETHPKMIVFYNFDYELDMLTSLCEAHNIEYAEWNGHKHQDIPQGSSWIYLVQYNAGNEGWNCIKTDTILFFSQNYSYKIMTQAAGRIDRLNTPYKDLYYYHLKSRSGIDLAISKALSEKKKFNETAWIKKK